MRAERRQGRLEGRLVGNVQTVTPFSAPISVSRLARAVSLTSYAPTNQPPAANFNAVARPIPEAAPVMKMDLRPLAGMCGSQMVSGLAALSLITCH